MIYREKVFVAIWGYPFCEIASNSHDLLCQRAKVVHEYDLPDLVRATCTRASFREKRGLSPSNL